MERTESTASKPRINSVSINSISPRAHSCLPWLNKKASQEVPERFSAPATRYTSTLQPPKLPCFASQYNTPFAMQHCQNSGRKNCRSRLSLCLCTLFLGKKTKRTERVSLCVRSRTKKTKKKNVWWNFQAWCLDEKERDRRLAVSDVERPQRFDRWRFGHAFLP